MTLDMMGVEQLSNILNLYAYGSVSAGREFWVIMGNIPFN